MDCTPELRDIATNDLSKAYMCVTSSYSKKVEFKERSKDIEFLENLIIYSSWDRVFKWNKSIGRAEDNGFELFHGDFYDACDF